jgi:hypothetical protein
MLGLALLVSLGASAQAPPGFTKISARYNWIAGITDSGFITRAYAGTQLAPAGPSLATQEQTLRVTLWGRWMRKI